MSSPLTTVSRTPSARRAAGVPPAEAKIYESYSPIHGRGIYARIALARDTRVVEYVGQRITKPESERRETRRLARQRRGGDGCVYIFELNRRYDLDGSGRANLARLINHSCAPNCRAEVIRGRIWIIAKRDIEPDEELTFDYGFPFREWRLHPCCCGARGCVGYIVNAGQRWLVRRMLKRARRAPASVELKVERGGS